MAAPPGLLRHGDNAVLRARHRAAHVDQVPLGVDPNDAETELGVTRVAVLAGQALALGDARGVGALRDRARLAETGGAVRGRTATETVAMNHTLEAATLGGPGNLDEVALGEHLDGHHRAR